MTFLKSYYSLIIGIITFIIHALTVYLVPSFYGLKLVLIIYLFFFIWNILYISIFNKIKSNIEANKINYIDKPYTRFEGTKFEQNTFFIEDPNGNVLELKTFD